MSLKNLFTSGCLIALSFFAMPAIAQNVKSQDTLHPLAPITSFSYGSQPKNSVTGAVSIGTPDNFNQGAIFNPVGQLAGKIAGLTITQSGGDPNQVASMSIRGQSSFLGNLFPLFVVDGVMLDNAAQFQSIPPDEIVSYEVLKDASASAIYGSRGANGVIIVTTRKGVTGKPVVSYSVLVGAGMQSKYNDLLSAGQYRQTISSLYPGSSYLDKGANTDWQKAVERTALQHRNSLSVSGGSNAITYLAGVDYQNQQGIILNSGKEQLGLRFNTELKTLADKLDVKAGVQYVNTTRKFDDYSNFSLVPNAPPTYPVKNTDGSYYAFTDFNEANAVEHFNEETLGDKEHLTLLNGSADYSITHDLKLGAFGSVIINKTQYNGYYPTFPLENNASQAAQSSDNTHSYDVNIHLNYDKTFGKNTLNLLGAYEYHDHAYDFTYAGGPVNDPPADYSGSIKGGYKYRSLIARVAYNYDERFYSAIVLREDVVSSGQHSYFPSVSAAYRFKKDLFANTDWISDFKLKAGYGVTGNSVDEERDVMLPVEKRSGLNVGVDFSLFRGRLSGDMNYFNDKISNLLLPATAPSPPFVENTPLTNGKGLTNKGLELTLSGKIISGHKINWTVNGQITFIATTVSDLTGQYSLNGQTYTLSVSQVPAGYAEGRGLSSSPILFTKTGYSPYVFYLPHFTGVDAQGNQTFDGKTIQQNPNPAGYYIDPAPKFNYGITNSFDYGNWNLTFALRGVYGQKIFDNTLLDIQTITRLPGNNVTKEALTNGIKDAPVASDLWLENASFLRLDNATLGHSFKNVSFAKILRIYVAANNLFVITSYKGLDPEVRTQTGYSNQNILFGANVNGSQNQPYIDGNYGGQAQYPTARVFSLGLNITLK